MGFGGKKSKGSSSSKRRDSSGRSKEYRKIGSMWESKHFDGHNMTMDDYSGDLIFRDNESGKFYKVKGASLFDPKEGAPKGLVYNMVINLESEYNVEEMDGEGSGNESDDKAESERYSKRKG